MLIRLAVFGALVCGGAALAQSAPAAATGPRDVTFGVGLITWNADGTDASFDANNFYTQHPLKQQDKPAKAYLVDFPTDAQWHLSGNLTGRVQTTYSTADADFWQSMMAYTSGLAIIGVPFIVLAIILAEPVFLAIGLVGTLVGGGLMGIEYALYRSAKSEDTKVTGSVGGTFVLRRQGKKDLEITVAPKKIDEKFDSEEGYLSRERILDPIWIEVGQKVQAQMAVHPVLVAEFGK